MSKLMRLKLVKQNKRSMTYAHANGILVQVSKSLFPGEFIPDSIEVASTSVTGEYKKLVDNHDKSEKKILS